MHRRGVCRGVQTVLVVGPLPVPIKLYLVLCRRAVGFRNVAVFDVSSAFSQATNPYSWSASAMFEWSKKYNIGVQIVDDEHKHLFDVIARSEERRVGKSGDV